MQRNPTPRMLHQGLAQEHSPRILNILLYLDKEGHRVSPVEQAVVVGKSKEHHGANLHLAIDGHDTVLDSVEAEHGTLRRVDDGRAKQGSEYAAVADGKGATRQVLERKLVIPRLERTIVSDTIVIGNAEKRVAGIAHLLA